jgi:hypothetical protein
LIKEKKTMKISAYNCDYNLDPPDDDEPESDVEEEDIDEYEVESQSSHYDSLPYHTFK